MTKYIRKLLLLIILPIIILLTGVEILLRHIPNDYYYKNKWLTEHISQIKILSIGASHGYYGINPQYFEKKAFNAAHVSQPLNYDLFIVEKFLSKCDSLQFLIIPISYPILFYSLENSPEFWRVKNYAIYYGYKYHKFEPKFNIASYDNNLLSSIKRIANFYIMGIPEINCSELGFGLNYSHDKKSKEWEKSGKIAAKRQTEIPYEKDYIENINYLNRIIQKCNGRKIKIVLLTTPTWHTYFEALNNKQLELTFTTCQRLAVQNKNVSYINMLYDRRFNANDFFDSDHLNEIGAKKLTKILNDTLNLIK